MKEDKQIIKDLTGRLESVEKQLKEECPKCDGTGKPQAKTKQAKINLKELAKVGKSLKCEKCGGTGILGYRLNLLEANVEKMTKEVNRLSTSLKLHLNKQSVEIRVLEDSWNENYDCIVDGTKKSWGDYSGTFDLDADEEMGIVIDKARTHFNTYFKDGFFHSEKTLGIFLSNPMSGKHLIEEIETD